MSSKEAACYESPSLILRGLYVGSKKNASQRAQLEKLGIVRILNATPSRGEDPRMGELSSCLGLFRTVLSL